MAAKPKINSHLEIDARWLPAPSEGPLPEVNHTLCRLLIRCGRHVATKFRTEKGDNGERIEVPAYYLAEWFAENWWSIFHEPEKREDELNDAGDDAGFRARHWIGAARNGFALPDMWLRPSDGETIVETIATHLRACRLSFEEGFTEQLQIDAVKAVSGKFIETVVARLTEKHVGGTPLHDAWTAIKNTGPDERQFCELLGALGLSPYEPHPEIEAELEIASRELSEKIVRDLCEAATPRTFVELSSLVRQAFVQLRKSPEVNLSRLGDRPNYRPNLPPWQWGYNAANIMRRNLHVQPADRESGKLIFEHLEVDTDRTATLRPNSENDCTFVEGAIQRLDQRARMAMVRHRELPQQRFAAARGIFLAWGAGHDDARLVTSARTREQQASRAFAAELLVPIDFIRRVAGRGVISNFKLRAIAQEVGVSPTVVTYQAINHRLQVASY